MYCLDSDVVIDFIRGDPAVANRIKRLQSAGANITITALTLCELYRGAFLSTKKDESLEFVNEFLRRVTLLTHNESSCLLFGEDYSALKEKGKQTQEIDLMIASICKANNIILVTRNLKDFKNIPNLMVEKW